jgi:hypothetical protein
MRKEIRINGSTGQVLDPERTLRVTREKSEGGPDTVRWLVVGKKSRAPFRVHFAHTPFYGSTAPPPEDVGVPGGSASATRKVAAPVGTYKYSVYDRLNVKTDDPSIIIVR